MLVKLNSAIKDYILFFKSFLLNKYKGMVVLAFALGLVSTIVSSVGLGLYLPVISSFFNSGSNTDVFTRLSHYLLALVKISPSVLNLLFLATLTIIAGALLNYLTFLFSGYLFLYTYREVKDRLIAKLLANKYAFFTKEKVGKIVLVLTEQSNKASSSVEILFRLCTHSMLAVGYIVALLLISVKLTLTMAIWGLVGLLVSFYIGQKMEKISSALVALKQKISSFFTESIVGIKTIKSMGLEEYRHEGVKELLKDESKSMFKAYACNYFSPLSTRIIAAVFCFACIYVGLFWFELKAEIVVFLVVTIRLNSSIYFMNQAWVNLAEGLPNIASVLEYFKSEEGKIETAVAPRVKTGEELPTVTLEKSVKFNNVSFAYSPEIPILKKINLEIKKNQFVALVGPSGGGKSTIVDLLLGLYSPSAGEVLYDEESFDDYSHKNMAQHIGVVSQDIFLFNASVKENISYGDQAPSLELIEKAAGLANAAQFIQNLESGYDTLIGDRGVKLSGGQRQRIALARALYHQPELLILDEATSALDTESERLIQKSLEDIYGQLTVVAVAHRLSTIKNADIIYYIDKGEIIESGTHEELIKKGNAYKKLCEIQFS